MFVVLGRGFHGLAVYDRAAGLYTDAIETYERLEDVDGVLDTQWHLAGLYANESRIDEAIALYDEIIAGLEASDPPREREAIRIGLEAAEVLATKGRFDDARERLAVLFERTSAAYGPSDPQTVAARILSAFLFAHRGMKDEANGHIDAALEVVSLPDAEYAQTQSVRVQLLGWVCVLLARHGDAERVYGIALGVLDADSLWSSSCPTP